jgi:hypothetical protein
MMQENFPLFFRKEKAEQMQTRCQYVIPFVNAVRPIIMLI